MSLAWNTKHLLGIESGTESVERTAVEYHLLSWRELYDKSILTADRYSSGAAEWVVRGDDGFYTVTVVSRPYYRLPQELCLSFDCFTQTTSVRSSNRNVTVQEPPIEQVALEFTAMFSVFARESIVPLGLRRENDRPIVGRPHYVYPSRFDRASVPPPFGVNSPEFISVLKGFAQARGASVRAVLAAAKFYHAGLSLITFDPSVAYISLVSAIECLAGHHYKDQEVEYSFRQKFVLFLKEFCPKGFWEVPDELYDYGSIFPDIADDNFEQCLREVYDARSGFLHGGSPFPTYVEFGLRMGHPLQVVLELAKLEGKQKYLPPLAWFERLAHMVIPEYMRRSFAPELIQSREERLAEKKHLLGVIASLPENVQDSLKRLTHCTAQFLPFAVISPYIPNKEWADSAETVRILREAGLIDSEGQGLKGSSWLKDREVGEVVGEFVFGVAANPFRDAELLLPKAKEEAQNGEQGILSNTGQ